VEETSLVVLEGAGGVGIGLFSWLDIAIFLRNGFFVSVSAWTRGLVKDDGGGLAIEEGGVLVCKSGEAAAGAGSRGNS
jgi:hypothetical protein